MNAASIHSALNKIASVLGRSLAVYLSYATPWVAKGGEQAAEKLKSIAADQQEMVNRLGQLTLELGGTIAGKAFPIAFPGYHDLGLDFLVRKTLTLHQQDLAAIEQCVEQLPFGSLARGLAEEARREARSHLAQLQQLVQQQVSGGR